METIHISRKQYYQEKFDEIEKTFKQLHYQIADLKYDIQMFDEIDRRNKKIRIIHSGLET